MSKRLSEIKTKYPDYPDPHQMSRPTFIEFIPPVEGMEAGEHKRFALAKFMEGKLTTDYPVTALINHRDMTIITDIENIAE